MREIAPCKSIEFSSKSLEMFFLMKIKFSNLTSVSRPFLLFSLLIVFPFYVKVPKLKADSVTTTPVRKSVAATPEAPSAAVIVTHKPTALFSPEITPPKAERAEPSSAAKIGLEHEITRNSNNNSTVQARLGQAAVDAIKRSASSSSNYNTSEREYDRGLVKNSEMGGSWRETPVRISIPDYESTGHVVDKERSSGSKVPATAVAGPILRSPSASGSSLPAPRQVSVAATDSMPSFHSIYDNNSQCDDDNSRKNPNWRGNSQHRPVTSVELNEALQLVKYDMHREIQGLMKEQVRQFSIAQVCYVTD